MMIIYGGDDDDANCDNAFDYDYDVGSVSDDYCSDDDDDVYYDDMMMM